MYHQLRWIVENIVASEAMQSPRAPDERFGMSQLPPPAQLVRQL